MYFQVSPVGKEGNANFHASQSKWSQAGIAQKLRLNKNACPNLPLE